MNTHQYRSDEASKREDVYFSGNMFMNVFLALWSFLFAVYLALPLLGGKFSLGALLVYGTWIICTIIGKIYFKRIRTDTPIKEYEGMIALLWVSISMAITLPLPYGILVGLFVSSGLFIGHRKKWETQKGPTNKAL